MAEFDPKNVKLSGGLRWYMQNPKFVVEGKVRLPQFYVKRVRVHLINDTTDSQEIEFFLDNLLGKEDVDVPIPIAQHLLDHLLGEGQ